MKIAVYINIIIATIDTIPTIIPTANSNQTKMGVNTNIAIISIIGNKHPTKGELSPSDLEFLAFLTIRYNIINRGIPINSAFPTSSESDKPITSYPWLCLCAFDDNIDINEQHKLNINFFIPMIFKLNNKFLPADGNRLTQKKEETWVLPIAKKGRPSTHTNLDTPTPSGVSI